MDIQPVDYKYGMLFGGEPVPASEKARVAKEIGRIASGPLTFTLSLNNEGWSAQCNEIPAIIAGNTNPSPTDIEIQSEIRAAIFAVFDVQMESRDVASPHQSFKYAIAG